VSSTDRFTNDDDDDDDELKKRNDQVAGGEDHALFRILIKPFLKKGGNDGTALLIASWEK
jgi:hypothetical protein